MTAVPNPPSRPVVDWVAVNRKPVAVAVLIVAVVCVAVAGYFLMKVARDSSAQMDTATDPAAAVTPSLYRSVHLWAGIDALAIAGICAAIGATSLARLRSNDAQRERYLAAAMLLELGVGVGLVLLKFGAALFRLWFDALVKWVDVRDASEAWKPLTALLVLLAGAGLMFAAAQPARADERNHGWIRRSVYGINFGLTVILLLFGLVALNVIVALKLPAKLDTTQNQVYTLTKPTEAYLANLTQKVQVTVTFTPELVSASGSSGVEKRLATDFRRLLDACQEANPRLFKVTNVHPVLNAADFKSLLEKHNGEPGAILEIAGQTEFLRANDLSDREGFRGEGELVKRLLFLTEDRDRTVYFTQGRGEPEVVPSPDRKTAGRTAQQIAEVLGRSNTEVKPLRFDSITPVVPDDASVLAILGPTDVFTPTEVAAIRTYMSKPRSNGKKGKLIIAAGPVPNREKSAVLETGLDPLLAEYGVGVDNAYLLGQRLGQFDFTDFIVAPESGAVRAEHPIAVELTEGALFTSCRVLKPNPAGSFVATPIGFSIPERRGTWFESAPPTNPPELYAGIAASAEVRRQKRFSMNGQWPLVVTVTEPGMPTSPGEPGKDVSRVVVFGSGDAFVDPPRNGRGGGNAALLGAAVNWLRERPAVASVASKPYGVYKPLRGIDNTTLLWLPVGITLLSVVALGFGIWSYRRK